jgi:hypothetical protein
MPASDKDTIYIDIDDEITGIIDKLRNSKGKVVALVLPKRASVFQSVVNMKLLKRAADAEKKNAVLITSEAGLLPLAGIAGVHVAKTLASKPEIPLPPQGISDAVEAIGEDGEAVEDLPADPKQTVGDLAAQAGTKPPADGVETLMLDADDVPPEASADGAKPGPKTFEPPKDAKNKKNKNKKLKVPNFERFRLLLILGVIIIILLIIGFIFANSALPKATITIKTDATNVNANLNLNLSTAATDLQSGSNTLPAKLVQQQKVSTASEVTTGQKNEGNTATGTVVMTATESNNQVAADVPAGTGLSANGLTYITQADTSFTCGHNKGGGNGDVSCQATAPTPITAQTGGASYNGASTFTVAGRSDVSAQVAQAIAGGTDNIVQTVNQNDITNAKAKISTNDTTVEQSLVNQLQQSGYFALKATYSPGTPNVTTSANVGNVANSVTVTETVTYTMFGVHKSDLASLVDNNIDGQINTSKQSILDNGINSAVFTVTNASATSAQLAMSAKAVAGPQINMATIKQQAEGQKSAAIQSSLETDPDIKSVTVKLSPFWVSTVPKNISRITVNVAKPTTTAKANSNGNNT